MVKAKMRLRREDVVFLLLKKLFKFFGCLFPIFSLKKVLPLKRILALPKKGQKSLISEYKQGVHVQSPDPGLGPGYPGPKSGLGPRYPGSKLHTQTRTHVSKSPILDHFWGQNLTILTLFS